MSKTRIEKLPKRLYCQWCNRFIGRVVAGNLLLSLHCGDCGKDTLVISTTSTDEELSVSRLNPDEEEELLGKSRDSDPRIDPGRDGRNPKHHPQNAHAGRARKI